MNNFNLNKLGYSVNELLKLLPIGRTRLYQAVKDGDLKLTKYGKRTWFLAKDVSEFLAKLEGGNNAA